MINEDKDLNQAMIYLLDAMTLDKENEEYKNLSLALQLKLANNPEVPSEDVTESKAPLTDLDQLKQTMIEGGAEFNKLKIESYSESNRGVFSSDTIRAGETVLFIPMSQIMTLKKAEQSPVGQKLIEKEAQLRTEDKFVQKLSRSHNFLAAFLLQEKTNKDSQFKDFLNLMPKSLNNFPVFFSDEEIE